MTHFKLLAAGVILATSAIAAHADNKVTLGAGVGIGTTPYKQYDNYVVPVPVLGFESENFWFRGLGGGYYLWNDSTDKLSITAYWDPMHFKPKDSDNLMLRKLDKRHSTMMAGLSYLHFTQYGFLRTTLAGDTLDNSNGIVWDLAWLYRYTNDGLSITPGIGVEWNSKHQNDYYYGVSSNEALKSGLYSYKPDDSWNPYLELSVNYNLVGNWSVYGTGRYMHLTNETTNSPMVSKSWAGILSTGVTYTF